MYSQLIYFIVVLLLFSLQPPAKTSALSYTSALCMLAVFLSFVIYCRSSFQKIQRLALEGVLLSTVSRLYHRALTRFFILAAVCMFIYVYIFNIKVYLRVIPGFQNFSTVSELSGLLIYILHLCFIWYYSFETYKSVHGTRVSRRGFVAANLSFSVVILLPWLLISSITDLLQFTRLPFLSTDQGQWMVVAATLFAFVLFGPWLMVRLWRCEPLPQDYLREELEKFCDSHGFRLGGFMLWPLFGGEMLTAGIVGVLPGLRYILITSGLLQILELDELKAVVAHEMGHVRKKHLLFFLCLFLLFMTLVYNFGDMLSLLALSNRTILHWALSPDEGAYFMPLVSSVPILALMVLFFRYIFGFFLRNSERQADVFALELLGTPQPLVSSFEKIAHHSGKVIDIPNWHHYSLRQRIDFIHAAFENPELVRKHNRKLYGAAIAFLMVMGLLFAAATETNRSAMAGNWRSEIQLGILENAVAEHPDDPELLGSYGGLLFEKGRYSEAESVLNAALTMDPSNAANLNNLAWLYATSPPPHRDPEQALELAVKAANLKPDPVVLDTLAEAYYVNGLYDAALEAINEALRLGGPERGQFLKTKQKIELAIKGRV